VLGSQGALAQQAPAAAGSSPIETVTVTAQFVQQNIQTAPLAVTAITAQDLDERGVSNLSQLTATVPSLTLNPTPAAFGNGLQAFIRGVGAFDTAFEHEPGVGIYIDDLYFGTLTGSELDLIDLNRVEVLRGPQGVLGGKNDIGGAIKLFTQKPTGDNSGYFEGTYGSFNEIYLKGAADLTIIPDHLFLRASGMAKHQDGYVNVVDYACRFGPGTGPTGAGSLPVLTDKTNCKLGTQGGTDVHGGRLALRFVLDPQLEDTAAIDIVRDDSEVAPDTLYAAYPSVFGPVFYNNGGGVKNVDPVKFFGSASSAAGAAPGLVQFLWNPRNLARYGIEWDQRFIPADPYRTTYATYTSQQGNRYTDGNLYHSWSFSNVLDWDICNCVHLKIITGYRQYNSAYSDDSDVSPMSFQLSTTYNKNKEFQQEERLTGTLFDNKLEWTAGFFHYSRDSRSTGGIIIDAIPLVFEQNDTYKTKNNSGYIHGIYHVLDNLEVFAGFRYTSETKTYYFNHIGQVPGYNGLNGNPGSGFFRSTVNPDCEFAIFEPECPVHAPLAPHSTKTSRPDWRAGLDYHLTDDIMAYFHYSTWYRTGGTNSRPFDPTQLTSYGPETIASYEIGAKTDWFDHRLRANIALYDAEYQNTIVPIATIDALGNPYVQNVNLGSSTNKGIELELTWAPVDDLLISGNYSYIDSKANPAPGAPPGFVDPLGTIPVGSPPALFPKQQFNISGSYTFHLGGWGELTPRVDYNWQDITYQAGLGSKFLAVPAHGILNARLAWDPPNGSWEVAVSATNLANKRYFYDMFNLAAFGFGTVTGNPAPPREFFLTIRKNF
jgi:iron complex outermembrane receptor protein